MRKLKWKKFWDDKLSPAGSNLVILNGMEYELYKKPIKIEARSENVKIFRKLTGFKSIPAGKEYWTLCNLQPLEEDGAEIVQLEQLGLLEKSQFHGVDYDTAIIDKNKAWHPEAHWYAGDWEDILRDVDFNPAMVYLDTVNFADNDRAARLISFTMSHCPEGTVLFTNVLKNDPRSSIKFETSSLRKRLERHVMPNELKRWEPKIVAYRYKSSRFTEMMTYVLQKLKG